MAKVAINGVGRIGRIALKTALEEPALDVVAVNDIVPVDQIAYLIKYDTVYGRYDKPVEVKDGDLVIDGRTVKYYSARNPEELPWGDLGVDIALECTGIFTDAAGLKKHITAGAKYAILSAPAKGGDVPTVVHAVNEAGPDAHIISCASCTTNSITPVVEIIGRRVGIKKAIMTTVHGYTSTQALIDAPAKKRRRGRAAAQNLVPTTTGAAIATTLALPQYEGKFDGVAVRVPVVVGSISDLVFVTERATSVDELNTIFREEAASERYKDVLGITEDEIVSSDIIGLPFASIVDLTMTQVVDGDLVKVMAWYDNEWGYTSQMVREAVAISKKL